MSKKLNQLNEPNVDNVTIIDYFQKKNIFHSVRYCPKCNQDGTRVKMKISPRTDVADGFGWRCSRCTKRIALRKDTFFESFKLSLRVIIQIIIHWAIQSRQVDAAALASCNRSSVISFEQRLRRVASTAANQSNTIIGGAGKIVEIDESLYIKVKNSEQIYLIDFKKILNN
jgi:hypothetical protein